MDKEKEYEAFIEKFLGGIAGAKDLLDFEERLKERFAFAADALRVAFYTGYEAGARAKYVEMTTIRSEDSEHTA